MFMYMSGINLPKNRVGETIEVGMLSNTGIIKFGNLTPVSVNLLSTHLYHVCRKRSNILGSPHPCPCINELLDHPRISVMSGGKAVAMAMAATGSEMGKSCYIRKGSELQRVGVPAACPQRAVPQFGLKCIT